MTSSPSRTPSARPTKPGIWLVLLFVFVSGMAFSSSAETDPMLRPVASGAGPVSLQAALPMTPWTMSHTDAAAESVSLAFLGVALIGAAGCWRQVLRRRRQAARPTLTIAAAAPVPHLRAVPRQRMAS
ncbi:MAG: hypothetical protein HYS05_17985 [Acidobacteria bacterium]|nr:hypothetical protein [Acidobacteriota bacterium]